jgi:ABC-2 type transport system ATP-binding protein
MIEARDLTRRFGEFTVVDGVSFTVRPGEIFGFLGPNGAGKTTTIRMLAGLLAPSSGSARVAGLDVATAARTLRARIGYMSQRFSLYGDLTVSENISLFAGLYGVPDERLPARRDWLLDMAELRGRERQLTAELPLGWKQRLALGCALLHEPAVLFLDEPTSGVDPLARGRFWELIDALSERGTTVLVSTHYMEEAEYCHRLALMNRGRLIALDSPSGVRGLLGSRILEVRVPRPAVAAVLLRGSPGVEDAALFGRALHVTLAAEGDEAAIAAVLAASGIEVASLRPIRPSLEDVFVGLVRREGGAVDG